MSYSSSRLIRYLRDHVIAVEVICTIVIVVVGIWCFHIFEGIELYDSVYYTIITIAGVGYGDITPVTNEGKMVAIVMASLGMPLYLITASLIATKMIEGMKKIKRKTTKTIISKVKALIIEDGKILFLKTERDDVTIWDLPGGTINYGERVENALIRRVIQEINAHIYIEKSLGIWRWVDQQTGAFSLCHTYIAHLGMHDKKTLTGAFYDKKTETIARVPMNDILSGTIDLENYSLSQLIKEQLGTYNIG